MVWRAACLLTLALLAAGCGASGRPKPADPALAQEALAAALDGWKRGDAGSRAGGRAVTLRDRDHKAGLKLAGYKVGESEPGGFEPQWRVTLELTGSDGRRQTRKALYSVSTHPALVVSRVDDD